MKNTLITLSWISFVLLSACGKDLVDTESTMQQTALNSSEPPPPVPLNLRLDPTFQQTPFTARLTWDAPGGIDILVYRNNSTQIENVVSANAFSFFGRWEYALDNLQQNTSYTFQVQSQAFSGVRSVKSDAFTFTTLPTNDRTPPSVPVLQMQSPIQGFIIARWTASTDNFDPTTEITYEIYNVQTGALVRKLKGTELQSSFDNVQVFEDCVPYIVKARDRTGNLSGASNVAKASFSGCN